MADGMGILQKAFYGMPIRTANAVQGFLNVLSQLLDEEKPEYLTVVFGAGSQEQEREPVVSLSEQISMLKERLASMGVHLIEREDHDTADIMGGEDFPQQGLIPDVALVEGQALAGELLHPVQAFGVGIAKIVDDHNTITAVEQLYAGVGSDIAGTAGNENIHKMCLLFYFFHNYSTSSG